jgi:hypothetical protein
MYFLGNQTSIVPLNSYYAPSPATPPAAPGGGTVISVSWVAPPSGTTPSVITSSLLAYYAIKFTPGKSELLPLPQQTIDSNPVLGGQLYGY